jgi:hypothetical protein
MIFNNAVELTEQILHLLFPHVLISMREKRLTTTNSSSSSSNSTINETTDSIEEELPIPSDTIESSSDVTSKNTKEEGNTEHRMRTDHDNYNQITLAALKSGAADIGSWDDNWKSVLSPLVKSWIR